MKKLLLTALLPLFVVFSAAADGGMWLMQQMADKYAEMKAQGLELEAYDIYNPDGSSLKDGVLQFGNGCTGVVVSEQGLVLTNHHCGYDQIQQHSSVAHNYLQDGFWAMSMSEELPNEGLTVTFIDEIIDVTKEVKAELRTREDADEKMLYLSPSYLNSITPKIVGKRKKEAGVNYLIKAFYGGNQYLMFKQVVYSDVRLVGAPPSSIGKFGEDTDNWAWPRHSGDFSIFRIYTDKKGRPAEYSPNNIPLKPKRAIKVAKQGLAENDFAMIMGFPGTTYHFFTPAEVEEWGELDNVIRIRIRDIRQRVMLEEMLANPETKIMYAAKYAGSQNGYKRAIGANWAITKRGLVGFKDAQMQSLLDWGAARGNNSYKEATDDISELVDMRKELRRRLKNLEETFLQGIELSLVSTLALEVGNLAKGGKVGDTAAEKHLTAYNKFFDKNYSPELDAKIAKALLAEYLTQIESEDLPLSLKQIESKFGGSVDAYVDDIYARSIYTSHDRFNAAYAQGPQALLETIKKDPAIFFSQSVIMEYQQLRSQLTQFDAPLAAAQRTYIDGMMQMQEKDQIWPDANLTLRFTFGRMKGYYPKDNVYYGAQTTLAGVMEKEDPNNWEYNVAPRLKELYERGDYGAYGLANNIMPVNICLTTHTTGGNSGSPVFNAKGELVGLNFDRNWEGVGGDIEYLPDYQRSIICDIRYLLFVVDKYAGCQRLLDEMGI